MEAEAEEKAAAPPVRRSTRVSARTQAHDSPHRDGWGTGHDEG